MRSFAAGFGRWSKPYWEWSAKPQAASMRSSLRKKVHLHIVVMDLSLPRLSGLDTITELRLRSPNLAISRPGHLPKRQLAPASADVGALAPSGIDSIYGLYTRMASGVMGVLWRCSADCGMVLALGVPDKIAGQQGSYTGARVWTEFG
jgi:hypothetical protein